MNRSLLSIALTLAFTNGALGQSVSPPSVGDVVRSATPPVPASPSRPLPAIGNLPPAPMSALPAGTVSVTVKAISVNGNNVIETSVLEKQVQDGVGKTLTLVQMEELATRLTLYYRTQGYFVARAYVPTQDLTDGHLKLRIVEGNYGDFILNNKSHVRDDVVQGLLDDIKDRDIVSLDTLERAMLIINDTPGVKVVKADVMPGQKVGTSDFAIGTEATPRYDGFLIADNHGSRYTGKERVSFGANWNSPTRRGDRLGISGLKSVNGDLLNARLAYSTLVRTDGTRVEGGVSRTTYTLGDAYSSLGATGTADSYEVNVTNPAKRTRNASVELSTGLVHRKLRDEVAAGNTSTRKTSNALSFRANGNSTHRMLGYDGVTNISGALTFGKLEFSDEVTSALDAAGARTEGSWSKLNLNATRLTVLPNDLQLTVTARAQTVLNNRNLDGSEKLTISGVGGVAAYPLGELAGDKAFVTRAELAAPFGSVRNVQIQGTTFTSWGLARLSKPFAPGQQTRQLADVGIGLNAYAGNALLRVMLATRVHGGTPTSEPAPRTRLLLQAGGTF